MKCLLIIFCVFLSASAELSPEKKILAFIRQTTDALLHREEIPTKERTACLVNLLNVGNAELKDDEYDGSIDDETPQKEQIGFAYHSANRICEMTENKGIAKQKFVEQSETLVADSEKKLRCKKSNLKRLKPDHDLVKNFVIDENCKINPDFGWDMETTAEDYERMKITKCSLEEFSKPDSPETKIHLLTVLIPIMKDTTTTPDEFANFALEKIREPYESRLKCLLDQIYDR